MKLRSLFFAASLVLFVTSCKSGSSSDNTTVTTVGSDYLPLSENQVTSFRVQGQETHYDGNGSIFQQDNFDQTGKTIVSALQSRFGLSVFPIHVIDFDGGTANHGNPVCYLGVQDGMVFGLNTFNTDLGTVLSKDVSTSKSWVGSFVTLPRYSTQGTVEAEIPKYINSTSQIYSNVLPIHILYNDSTSDSYTSTKVTCEARAYLAKGVGIVGADIIKHEKISYYLTGPNVTVAERHVITGTIGRSN